VQTDQRFMREDLIEAAERLHGHLGPFLVVGVKMGLLGLRKLGSPRNNRQLRVTAKIKEAVPYTCALDGIQMATQCTIGNRRLKLENSDSSTIAATFRLKDGTREVEVTLKTEVLRDLEKRVLGNKVSSKKLRELAWEVALMPEDELFLVQNR